MPTAPPRKRAPARKAPVKKAATFPVIAGEGFEPLRLESAVEQAEPERVVIAYLDDYELTMPTAIPPNVSLKVIRTARQSGDGVAMMQMLEEVLGPEGYDRLANWPSLTSENLEKLFAVVQHVAMGPLETPKASSRNG